MRLDKIFDLLKFDEEDSGFELLESEAAGGCFFGGSAEKDSALHENGACEKRIPATIPEVRALLNDSFCTDVNKDLIICELRLCRSEPVLIAYMNGMADAALINDFIIRPIKDCFEKNPSERLVAGSKKRPAIERLRSIIEIAESEIETGTENTVNGILRGMTAVFAEGGSRCILYETRGFEKRAIGTADNETVVLGPKESFTESIRTNITLIRRLVQKSDLVAEFHPSGGLNNTQSALLYRKGFTDERLINEVRRRLSKVKLSGFIGSGMLEQMIEDRHFLPLPQTLSTERPDRAASHIMNGCVCLLVDGSPFAVVLPITLFSLMNSSEDVYLRKPLGTLVRVVRYAGALISLILPGYFLALAMYHQGGLTTEVLSTVISSRKMVFEPIAIEMILLLLVFQLIREAGLRVPGSIGQAIGIIGGLIMGQAAVAANLASSVVLIIVALSGLGNFCIPDYSLQLSAAYFRMALVIAAWVGGLLAMVSVSIVAAASIVSQKSFGVPFLSPLSPKTNSKRGMILRGEIKNSPRPDDVNNTVFDAEL